MERAAARLNSIKLSSSSQEMRATFNWDLSSRDMCSADLNASPKLSAPFATTPEESWPASKALSLRTSDIPGAQSMPALRPLTQVRKA